MKLELKHLKKHFSQLKAGDLSEFEANDVKDGMERSIADFSHQIISLRSGKSEDNRGNKIVAYDISLDEALKLYYGIDGADSWMRALGIYKQSMSFMKSAEACGVNHINITDIEELLIKHTTMGLGIANTKDIADDFRFVIPELILNAIRIGYEGGSLNQNWIATTQNISQRKITMPNILRGDAFPKRISEGGSIPMGSVKFGQKEATVFKIGTGFSITDELVDASSMDLMMIFLEEVGIDMSIGTDTEAMNVLVNGEQSNGSESSPVVGTLNGTSFTFKDIKGVVTRMRRLKHEVNRLVTGEDDGIDIDTLPEYEGFDGPTRLASLQSLIGVPATLQHDIHILPADQVMFIAQARAMAKLKYKGLMVERERDIDKQETRMVISDHVGFAIIRRDARVLLDKSVTKAGTPFPAFMDVDARISEAYEK